jgi:hypothetical protein
MTRLVLGVVLGMMASGGVHAESTVSGGGVTLRSADVTLPTGERTFAGGAAADAINSNCLTCHSVGMISTQPKLQPNEWQAEVQKMRSVYKAPIQDEDVPAIVAYLSAMQVGQ